jgi:type IV pilus assembly protein PilB
MATSAPAPNPGEHFLQKIKLFSTLSSEECQQIVARMKTRDFPPQQIIVREGAPGASMYFITSGLVEVRKKDLNTGIDFFLCELGAGQNFGEMCMLSGHPRSATVTAVQPTSCAILEQPDLERLILSYPKIGLALTQVLADRLEATSQHFGAEFVNIGRLQFDPRVLALLPQPLIQQHKVIPISFCNNRLTLAMVNPNNLVALDDVRRIIKGVMIEPVVTTEDDFKKFMTTIYPQLMKREPAAQAANVSGSYRFGNSDLDLLQSDLIRDLQLADDSQQLESKQDLMSASEDAPIIRLGNSILGLAIQRGASDIHVEPMENDVIIRYRIDGVLQTVQRLPKKVQLGLISRLKIISKLDISEKRMPQDGRLAVTVESRPIDFRVSTIPAKWGEKVCMRLLDRSNTAVGLDKLITHPPTLKLVRELIRQPYGILYVTGPTGSGKTTTLYSALTEINEPGVNISTAEDPIEYDLHGVNQVQVNSEIGLDFARLLRSFLRQDPDIMLVGETRDKETAHISVEAALTGHLVFTTLHTNNAAGAFTRLVDMGIEPFLVSSSTIGVMAQRLARRLCSCKEAYTADDATCAYLGLPKSATLYRARGCAECAGKGLKGRIGIYEVMKMNSELRNQVAHNSTADELQAAANKQGMLDLKQYAAWLLLNGDTSVEEVLQVVSVQE